MAAFWSKQKGPVVFKWDETTSKAFARTYLGVREGEEKAKREAQRQEAKERHGQDILKYANIPLIVMITEQLDEVSPGRTETTYLGWHYPHGDGYQYGVKRIPIRLTIARGKERAIESADDEDELSPSKTFGYCTLLQTSDEERMDGISPSLVLPPREYRRVRVALLRHSSDRLPPQLRLHLAIAGQKTWVIRSYYLITFPLDVKRAFPHPYTDSIYDEHGVL